MPNPAKPEKPTKRPDRGPFRKPEGKPPVWPPERELPEGHPGSRRPVSHRGRRGVTTQL